MIEVSGVNTSDFMLDHVTSVRSSPSSDSKPYESAPHRSDVTSRMTVLLGILRLRVACTYLSLARATHSIGRAAADKSSRVRLNKVRIHRVVVEKDSEPNVTRL